uniref:Uncharacterized protein n=1 Tax=Strix occidentalis caurina TaxID=311401 RepID=A0A8D0FV57_STROC
MLFSNVSCLERRRSFFHVVKNCLVRVSDCFSPHEFQSHISFKFTVSNPSFFSINTVVQFSIVAPSNSDKSSQKRREEGKKKTNIVENVFRMLELQNGLMLADYNSVASHFRFI